jgi:iduronate 2-sulfatase
VEATVRRGDFLGRTVKTREWRYTEWDDGNKGTELYDELNDPIEYRNLAGDHAYDSVRAVLSSLMIRPGAN